MFMRLAHQGHFNHFGRSQFGLVPGLRHTAWEDLETNRKVTPRVAKVKEIEIEEITDNEDEERFHPRWSEELTLDLNDYHPKKLKQLLKTLEEDSDEL